MFELIDSTILITHQSEGKIDDALRSKLNGYHLKEVSIRLPVNTLVAVGESVQRYRGGSGSGRLLLGTHLNIDPTADLSYETFKTLVGACIVVDMDDEVRIFTDPFNKLLMYKVRERDRLYISNNLPLLLSILQQLPKPNVNQLIHHLVHSIPFNDDTLLENVFYLPPHSIYTVSSSYCTSYLPDHFFTSEPENVLERKDEIYETLKFNLDTIVSHFDKSLLPLTAGNDSRVMLAILEGNKSVGSLTWGGENSDDVNVAKKLAGQASIDHTIISLEELKSGIESLLENHRDVSLGSLLGGKLKHTFLLNEAMKEIANRSLYEVEINGVGGELVRAFYYKRIKSSNRLSFYRDVQHSSRLTTLKDLGIFSEYEINNYLEWYDHGIDETPKTRLLTDEEYSEYMVHEYRFCRAWSPRYNASKLNRIESIYPFLSLGILENSYKLPLQFKIRNQVLVDMIKRSNKKYLRIPINNVDHRLLGKIQHKLTGRRREPQSTSIISNSLLHDTYIQEHMKTMLHSISTVTNRIPSNSVDTVYQTLRDNLKPQLVFRVLFSLDYLQRLAKQHKGS